MKKIVKTFSLVALGLSLAGSIVLSASVKEKSLVGSYDPEEGAYLSYVLTEEERQHIVKLEPAYKPTDTYYNTQKNYSMNNVGDIESVWDDYKGDGVTIAVIDSGIDYRHPDFYYNPSDYSTCKILPESKYFYTNTSTGKVYESSQVGARTTTSQQTSWDIIDHDWDSSASAYSSHGSNVASTAAGAANGQGVVGIAPNASILALKVDFILNSVCQAIDYAVEQGADVINMSLTAYAEDFVDGNGKTHSGSYSSTATKFNASVKRAHDAGVIVVAAAGNDKTDVYAYPASTPYVIGVGALDSNSNTQPASFTNLNKTTDTATGNHNVDVVAPGHVYVADEAGTQSSPNYVNYKKTQGTSFSSPIVAGAAALYRQKHPSASVDKFEEDLYASASDIGDEGWDKQFGYGRLDIKALLDKNTAVEGVNISQSSATIYAGSNDDNFKTVQLGATVYPENAHNTNVTWSSSNTNIATVSSTGLVTAKNPGTATITVTTQESGYTATCAITVQNWVAVTGVTLLDSDGHTSCTLAKREQKQLITTISPNNATNPDYIFDSNDTSVATIADDGLVTAVDEGTATITVITDDGYFEAYYEVTVTAPSGAATIFMNFYNSAALTATSGTDATIAYMNSHVTLNGVANNTLITSFDKNKTTVQYDKNGGLCLGASGKTGTIIFSISEEYTVETVKIVGCSYDSGKTFTVNGKSADKGSIWSTKQTAIEDITTYLEFDNVGSSSLNISTYNGRATIYTIELAISGASTVPVTGVEIKDSESVSVTNKTLTVEDTFQLNAVITPDNATNKNVTWSTQNSAIATVSSTGLVTAVSAGSTTITVTTEDGNKTDTVNLTVNPKVTDSVTINETATVKVDETTNISATASGTVTWSKTDGTGSISLSNQSNTGVTITGVSAGSATVTATVGSASATCAVTVTSSSSGETPTWTLINSTDDLTAGSVVTLACNTKGKVAGAKGTNAYLSAVDATFSSDKSTITSTSIYEMTLGGSTGEWTFTTSEGVLGTGAAKSMVMDDKTMTWTISFSGDNVVIGSTTTSYGKIYYNASSPRFLNYASSQTAIQMYKKSGGTTPNPDEPITVTGVTVSPTTLTLDANGNGGNKTSTLSAFLETTGTTGSIDRTINWSSGNTSIATVNSDGKVTAVAAGSTTITATSAQDSTKFASCSVTVTANTRELQSIAITTDPVKTSYTVGDVFDPTGAVVTATYNYAPLTEDVTDQVTWTPTGALTLENTKAYASFGGKTAEVNITVKDNTPVTSGFEKVTTMEEITDGDYVITGFDSNKYYAFVDTFASSNNYEEVTVTNDVISAGDAEGFIISIKKVTGGYKLSSNNKWLISGSSTSFSTGTSESQGTTFTIDEVNGKFEIKGSSRGIIYRTGYGFKNYSSSNYTSSGYFRLTLFKSVSGSTPDTVPVTGVSLNNSTLSLDVNDTSTLVATIAPSNASNKNVTWSSSDNAVATVSSAGLVTAVSSGTATITVTTQDGGFTATCTVTVNGTTPTPPSGTTVTQITFDAIEGELDGDANVYYKAEQGNATSAPGVFSSQIRVYQNGGTFTVTAKNGKKITSVTIGSDMSTTVGYQVDDDDYVSGNDIAKGDKLTISNLSADEIVFTCEGTDKSSRLYVNYLSVTYAGESSSPSEDAIAWAKSFNQNLTCDGGVTAPNKTVWSTQATAYAALSSEAKAILVNATYTVSSDGNTVAPGTDVDVDVAKAVSKYDYIVDKYGESEYNNFMSRSISSNKNNNKVKDDSMMILITGVSLLTITTFGAYLLKRKKVN